MEDYPQVPASIAERYRVGRMIGDGNFALVRECVERSTGREYALKIINKSKCRGKVTLRFKKILFDMSYSSVITAVYPDRMNARPSVLIKKHGFPVACRNT